MDIRAPDAVQQLFPRKHPARMLHQELQQPELRRAQMDAAPVALHAMCRQVHRDVVEHMLPPHRHGARPAQQCAHPRQQRVHAERLCDVIVGPGIEPPHSILILCPRRDHDHRQVPRGRAAADLAADLDPAHHRQHPIQQHDIRHRLGHAGQRLLPV